MPSGATGGALSGAASGAATGSAFGPWGTAIGAVVGGIGGYLSGSGTQQAQNQANAAAAQAAAMQSAQSFANYLSSRGVSLQQVVAAHPEYQSEWNRVKAAGDKRDFQTWLYDHLRSNPNDNLWKEINSGSVGAQNTTLPAWAVDANGNPLQPALLQQLLGINTGANNPATAPIGSIATLENARALLQARPDLAQQLADAGVGSDGRTPEQWLVDHITQTESTSGGGTFTDALRQFLATPTTQGGGNTTTPAGPAGTGNTQTLDPAIAAIIPGATRTVGNIFDDTYLNQVMGALKPVQDARLAGAAADAARINELRGLSTNLLTTELGGIGAVKDARLAGADSIYGAATAAANSVHDANITKLADLLGVRREAAAQIYDATMGAAGGVRDARTTGAKGIYDAELKVADTYGQAAKDALSRVLAEQTAERARRGFTGGSSGSDITRARLNADYFQRGAGVRAQAGVGYQTRLSDAGVGYAQDTGRAGIGRATTLGQANELDAIAKLNAAVQLAQQLGAAGVGKATSIAGTNEQDAIAQLQARVADATRRLGYLTSDADKAKAAADLANAQDALNAIIGNQNRQIGAIGAPYQLAGYDLTTKGAIAGQQYTDWDNLIKRLQAFTINPASGPSLTTSTPSPVLNNSQIAGGAVSALGSIIGNQSNTTSLIDLIKALGSAGGGSGSGPGAGTTNPYPLGSSTSFLGNASVFAGPGG